MHLGACYLPRERCLFTVWAPHQTSLAVQLLGPPARRIHLRQRKAGYWRGLATGIRPGDAYQLVLANGAVRPDPATMAQPLGVHGPSQVIDPKAFSWGDRDWRGYPLEDLIIYELHVGTFTDEGTFTAIIPRLPALRELGITAIELMPVAQFPGQRNWGYDGVAPFAVQNSYGGPAGLQRLVDACHRNGLAVLLDVVYNHLGPEGNYLGEFGPYFTDRYRTPWGEAVNFDGPGSDGVRRFFLENALYWLREYHLDGLRLDALHAVYDRSARPFLAQLAARVQDFARRSGRRCHLIAESDLNDVKLLTPTAKGGYGLDAQWLDDFHHILHTLLSGERQGYYQDFQRPLDLVKCWHDGFIYDGRYSSFRQRRHGSSSAACAARQFVIFSQNHDQVGNRGQGERLLTLAGFEAAKLAASTVLLSAAIPLLFMGEEYGETAPFQYFVSFTDPQLTEAVRRGRQLELQAHGDERLAPDPAAPETFAHSHLRWHQRQTGRQQVMVAFYRELIALRTTLAPLKRLAKAGMQAALVAAPGVFQLRRSEGTEQVLIWFNFNRTVTSLVWPLPAPPGNKRFDSATGCWLGPGSTLPDSLRPGMTLHLPPQSCSLYQLEKPTS